MPKPKHIIDGSPEDVEWKRKEKERIANYRANKQKGNSNVKQPQKTTLAIQQIVADESIQPRAEIKPEIAREYSEAIEGGAIFPPLIVFYDGQHYWLAEGFHRRKAYEMANVVEVPVEIREGGKREAVLHAVGSNDKHGIQRSVADKRRAVEKLLEQIKDDEVSWSNRQIARQCNFVLTNSRDLQMISDVRRDFENSHYPHGDSENRKFVDKHGNISTMNTSNLGRKSGGTSSGGGGGNNSSVTCVSGDEVRFMDAMTGEDVVGYYVSPAVCKDVHGKMYRASNIRRMGAGLNDRPDRDDDELEDASLSETDGYGRPVTSATVTSDSDTAEPESDAPEDSDGEADAPQLTPEERAAALPLYQAMKNYGHVGHLLLSAATAWCQLEEARNKFSYAHSRIVPKHATGTVFDEMQAFLRIPNPERWEGCAACKGSMRVGDGEKCNSCKGGFTTHVGEGVSADVVSSHATKTV